MIFSCKKCGGQLDISPGVRTVVCDFCGSEQTIPSLLEEKQAKLMNRANRLRIAAEFDRAAACYEMITAEMPEEAEAYWGKCLCDYGIEYVDDPATGKKVPTCHRTRPESILDCEAFQMVYEFASEETKGIYRKEAKEIDSLQRRILEVAASQEQFDVFICYKETTDGDERTEDSVLAQDIYDALTEQGLRCFFARVTLESRLGEEYEPIIYAALRSANLMIVIGTDASRFQAPWVRNEWSRYLKMMADEPQKKLIPCYKSMDPYDMPEEFRNLQAQDMGKIGWLQDLVPAVMKLCGKADGKTGTKQTVEDLRARAWEKLNGAAWDEATQLAERVLEIQPEDADSYQILLLASLKCPDIEALAKCSESFEKNPNYLRILQYSDEETKKRFTELCRIRKENARAADRKELLDAIRSLLNRDIDEEDYEDIRIALTKYPPDEEITELIDQCGSGWVLCVTDRLAVIESIRDIGETEEIRKRLDRPSLLMQEHEEIQQIYSRIRDRYDELLQEEKDCLKIEKEAIAQTKDLEDRAKGVESEIRQVQDNISSKENMINILIGNMNKCKGLQGMLEKSDMKKQLQSLHNERDIILGRKEKLEQRLAEIHKDQARMISDHVFDNLAERYIRIGLGVRAIRICRECPMDEVQRGKILQGEALQETAVALVRYKKRKVESDRKLVAAARKAKEREISFEEAERFAKGLVKAEIEAEDLDELRAYYNFLYMTEKKVRDCMASLPKEIREAAELRRKLKNFQHNDQLDEMKESILRDKVWLLLAKGKYALAKRHLSDYESLCSRAELSPFGFGYESYFSHTSDAIRENIDQLIRMGCRSGLFELHYIPRVFTFWETNNPYAMLYYKLGDEYYYRGDYQQSYQAYAAIRRVWDADMLLNSDSRLVQFNKNG